MVSDLRKVRYTMSQPPNHCSEPGGSVAVAMLRPARRVARPLHVLAMKPRFVVDGRLRLERSPEFQSKLRALRESIRARHEAELSSTGFFQHLIIRWRMALEYRRERRSIVPSSQSLYSSGVVTRTTHEHDTIASNNPLDRMTRSAAYGSD